MTEGLINKLQVPLNGVVARETSFTKGGFAYKDVIHEYTLVWNFNDLFPRYFIAGEHNCTGNRYFAKRGATARVQCGFVDAWYAGDVGAYCYRLGV